MARTVDKMLGATHTHFRYPKVAHVFFRLRNPYSYCNDH